MILSLKAYKEKRKELTDKIQEYNIMANEALMMNNWMEYAQINKALLRLRHELAVLDGRSTV